MKLSSANIMAVALVTSTAASAQIIQPGRWEIVSTPTAVDMPGAPPQIAAMMKNRPTKMSLCITPEQAKLGPKALGRAGQNCRYVRFDVRGHHIDSQMICNHGGGTMTVTASGDFTSNGFVTDGRSVMTGRQKMTLATHAVGRHTGNCRK